MTAHLILNSGRCSHGRCFFCGYGRIRGFEPTEEDVIDRLRHFFAELADEEVKVFGSGSFFDEKQVPRKAREYFIGECRRRGVRKITVESRPEYVKADVLREFRGFDLTVALGLESSDEAVMRKLNKGYGRREYEEAADVIHGCGFKVRTYLLVNPPFTQNIVGSLDRSVEYALKHSDSVVLINTLPHANAPLMKLWVSGEWNFLSRREFTDATAKWKNNPSVELDAETFRFIPSFPDEMRERLRGVGEWYLTHPHFEVWQDYIIRWYEPPNGRVLLLLPCSNRKPYSESATHQGIIKALGEFRRRFHEVMLSNAGVIPREFEDRYPFNTYDWEESFETPEIKRRYVEVTAERISKYLTAHGGKYLGVACFLKYDSESYQALENACSNVGVGFKNLLSKETYEVIKDQPRPLQTVDALRDLSGGASWFLRNLT